MRQKLATFSKDIRSNGSTIHRTKPGHARRIQEPDTGALVQRAITAERFDRMHTRRTVPQLIQRLAYSDAEVRMRAAEALGDILPVGASSPELRRLLTDPDELVRIAAAQALGILEDPKALKPLWRASGDESELVRSYVFAAIGRLGGERDLKRLRRLLRDEKSETARVGLCEGLCILGITTVLPAMLQLLSSSDYRVRSATSKSLVAAALTGMTRGRIIEALKRAQKYEKTRAARLALKAALHKAHMLSRM